MTTQITLNIPSFLLDSFLVILYAWYPLNMEDMCKFQCYPVMKIFICKDRYLPFVCVWIMERKESFNEPLSGFSNGETGVTSIVLSTLFSPFEKSDDCSLKPKHFNVYFSLEINSSLLDYFLLRVYFEKEFSFTKCLCYITSYFKLFLILLLSSHSNT